jgi:hypothetical protein
MLLFFPIFFPINDYKKTVKYWFNSGDFPREKFGEIYDIYNVLHALYYILYYSNLCEKFVEIQLQLILMLILFMLISDDIYVIEKIVNGTFFFLS